MFLNHKRVLEKITKHKGAIAIWGLSDATKKFFTKHPKLYKSFFCIIDNNIELQGKTYLDISIVSFEQSLEKKDLLIVILGNHISSILSQIKTTNFRNYIIDYEYSKNFIKKDLIIEIDYVTHETQKEFCDTIIEFCTENLLECHIKPHKYIDWPMDRTAEDMFKNIVAIDVSPHYKTLIFSAHTVGDSNPQIFRWKIGYLYKTITFDDKGYSGWSSLALNPEVIYKDKISKSTVNSYFKTLENRYIKKNISKYKQTNIGFDFPKEFIFFPLQLFNDTVMLQSNFEPLELFKNIVKILNKKNIALVVKRHPLCNNKKLEKLLLKYQNNNQILLFDGSIHDAISRCSTVYVINSGVGFEALLHLKPVVSFGKSDYMSVTRNISNLKQIEENPWYLLNDEQKDKIKLFLYYFMNEKCVSIDNKKDIKRKITAFIVNYLNEEYL
ncbi:hypothetical protein [Aliarcobacter butzleri]|uniref:capsular polysaccharide export protein, LipB/KpsS family n=1 Tax=Aliarcobacter butzleri TaxID=28197 RepID=UPI003B20E778